MKMRKPIYTTRDAAGFHHGCYRTADGTHRRITARRIGKEWHAETKDGAIRCKRHTLNSVLADVVRHIEYEA